MARPILYATDFSDISANAFDEAVNLCKSTHAELVVAHILHYPPMLSELRPMAEDVEEQMRVWCKHRLSEMVAKAGAAGVTARAVLREGVHPHAGIDDLAAELNAERIVMGTHGRTGLSKMVMGSVAARVIVGAPCPVVTVHAAA